MAFLSELTIFLLLYGGIVAVGYGLPVLLGQFQLGVGQSFVAVFLVLSLLGILLVKFFPDRFDFLTLCSGLTVCVLTAGYAFLSARGKD